MNNINMLIIALLISIAVMACSADKQGNSTEQTDPATPSASSADLEKLISEAETTYDKAAKLGAAWRDTKEMLNSAREATTKNELDKANKLAQQALDQSKMALQQQAEQKNAGPYLF